METKEFAIGQIRKLYNGNYTQDLYLILEIDTERKNIYVFLFENQKRTWWHQCVCIKDDVLVG